jgi:hypothetical protein
VPSSAPDRTEQNRWRRPLGRRQRRGRIVSRCTGQVQTLCSSPQSTHVLFHQSHQRRAAQAGTPTARKMIASSFGTEA